MKNILKVLVASAFILYSCYTLKSQDQLKLGHINSQELFDAMPEKDTAQKKLENIAKEIENTLEELQVEYNKKLDNYQQNVNTMSDLIRTTKENELQDLLQRIQQFQVQAEQDLARQRSELFLPIQEKALKAINEVAEEHGFTYVFDMSVGVVLFASDSTQDILPLVKVKLGLE
jgi:outer membrane protein